MREIWGFRENGTDVNQGFWLNRERIEGGLDTKVGVDRVGSFGPERMYVRPSPRPGVWAYTSRWGVSCCLRKEPFVVALNTEAYHTATSEGHFRDEEEMFQVHIPASQITSHPDTPEIGRVYPRITTQKVCFSGGKGDDDYFQLTLGWNGVVWGAHGHRYVSLPRIVMRDLMGVLEFWDSILP